MPDSTPLTLRKPSMLVIDDEPGVLSLISRYADKQGFSVIARDGRADILTEVQTLRTDCVLVDLRLPQITGIDVLRAVRAASPECQVILMTGGASIDSAIEAVKLGALDYLTKPLDLARLGDQLAHVRFEFERRRRLLTADAELAGQLNFQGLIGRSPVMQELFSRIRRLAPHVRTALITGETGTGKELVAHALHKLSGDASRRLVSCNCAAIAETLFESEFFGHERGAFTGAHQAKRGLFEQADRGTLFLDEVGELPLAMQPKLLRALEYGEFKSVGGNNVSRVTVRTVAATNRDLLTEVQEGRFRADLYYRLNVVEFRLAPLRERREDISYLSAAFVREFSHRFGRPIHGFTPGAERLLHDAAWPGNVRELRHVLERACLASDGDLLTERDIAAAMPPTPRPLYSAPATADRIPPAPARSPAAPTADEIRRALEATGGNRSAAARMLGLGRRSFYRRLDALGL